MTIPKFYIALITILMVCASTVGYKHFANLTKGTSSRPDSNGKASTKTSESANTLVEKESSEIRDIKSTGKEKQKLGKKTSSGGASSPRVIGKRGSRVTKVPSSGLSVRPEDRRTKKRESKVIEHERYSEVSSVT